MIFTLVAENLLLVKSLSHLMILPAAGVAPAAWRLTYPSFVAQNSELLFNRFTPEISTFNGRLPGLHSKLMAQKSFPYLPYLPPTLPLAHTKSSQFQHPRSLALIPSSPSHLAEHRA